MNRNILVVDDDQKIAHMIAVRLKKQGYPAATVSNGKDALKCVEEQEPVLVLLDVRLPDIDGVAVLKGILERRPKTFVVMISAHAEVQVAVECIQQGAADFLEKPFEFPALDAKVKHFLKQAALEEEVETLKKELGAVPLLKTLVGTSSAMRKVFQSIKLVAATDATVLIEGESGTGKELVARAIHASSAQNENPFVAVNCGAIPEKLIESELFGHEKGAFTGAVARKIGKFEQASNGTLFLDEITELPLMLQVKLLRVLQEREIERVGGTGTVAIQTRVIAASNQDLRQRVREGTFREDLFYRINVFPIKVSPLRDRVEDIPELFSFFLERHGKKGKPYRLEDVALNHLKAYSWPGNVRELENFVQRLVILLGDRKSITEKDVDLPNKVEKEEPFVGALVSGDRKHAMAEAEKEILIKALEESGGNITEASKRVQISRDTFYRKMKKYAITP